MDNSDIYCSGRTKSTPNGTWDLFLVKYTNRLSNAAIPAAIQVKGPDGKVYLNVTGSTDSNGRAGVSFTLPADAPEGTYECSVTAYICGTAVVNRTRFDVVWPWSPVLTLDSPLPQIALQPGDTLPLRAYAGYEYLPAKGKKPAPPSDLSADIFFPNGTLYFTVANTTNSSGWTDLDAFIPKSAPAGNYTVRFRGFENLSREMRIEVLKPAGSAAPPVQSMPAIPVVPVLGSASAAIIIIAAVVAGTEMGRFGLLATFGPLYSRIRRDKALDNRIRHQILGYLTENPGEHYTALKRALKLSNSVMVYHLSILEQGGFIRSRRDGTMKRFYPSSVQAPETRQRTPEELTQDILEAVAQSPGITRRELVERLVVSEEVIAYRLRKLAREGKVTAPKQGKTRVYYPVGK